ncbi:hypothetical protein [Fluviicola sp.]|uniref:hypothetical protein n=1 Tax=Fluviicola sp. TaxID=1917219 RepID=UPI002605E105|nr:hypothetical protein [Fluviicola sp.]
MKPVFYILSLAMFLASCKKGKTLPHVVAVQLITTTEASVYLEKFFPPFDPSNPNETLIYPSYAHEYSTSEIATKFNQELVSSLNKNNLTLQTDTAIYVLKITNIRMSESVRRESYIDSCSFNHSVNFVSVSSLHFQANAALYKNGVLMGTWKEEGNSGETVRSKTDSCNKPKIRRVLRGPSSLINQVAKEVRVRVSKKMYELEV